MSVQDKIKRALQVDFELTINKDGLVLWETVDYHFETVLTKAQVKELIDVLTNLHNQMG